MPNQMQPQMEQGPSVNQERIQEIAEAVVDEKWNEIVKSINKIILVAHPDDRNKLELIIKSNKLNKIIKVADGGVERQDSAYNGIKAIKNAGNEDIILIHNAANPFVDEATINNCISAAKKYGAAAVGFPAKDTIKFVEDGFVKQTIDRRLLWQAQTPQAMKYFLAKKAFEGAYADKFYGTDDASLVERLGGSVKAVYCPRENIKITEPYDLAYAHKMANASKIGIGQDSHKFSTYNRLNASFIMNFAEI